MYNIYIYLLIENKNIKKCFWNGSSCVITSSSTDIMCELIIDKNVNDAIKIINEYFNMIQRKKIDKKILKEAIVFINIINNYQELSALQLALM